MPVHAPMQIAQASARLDTATAAVATVNRVTRQAMAGRDSPECQSQPSDLWDNWSPQNWPTPRAGSAPIGGRPRPRHGLAVPRDGRRPVSATAKPQPHRLPAAAPAPAKAAPPAVPAVAAPAAEPAPATPAEPAAAAPAETAAAAAAPVLTAEAKMAAIQARIAEEMRAQFAAEAASRHRSGPRLLRPRLAHRRGNAALLPVEGAPRPRPGAGSPKPESR